EVEYRTQNEREQGGATTKNNKGHKEDCDVPEGKTNIRNVGADPRVGPGVDHAKSAPIVESWRLDSQRAQVHVTLTAMMNLVVDDVEDEIVDHAGVLPECR